MDFKYTSYNGMIFSITDETLAQSLKINQAISKANSDLKQKEKNELEHKQRKYLKIREKYEKVMLEWLLAEEKKVSTLMTLFHFNMGNKILRWYYVIQPARLD